MRKQILYVVKFKDLFNNEKYLPYFFEDIICFIRDLKQLGYTDIMYRPFINHNNATRISENKINSEIKKSNINEECIQKALKSIYNYQEENKNYDKY